MKTNVLSAVVAVALVGAVVLWRELQPAAVPARPSEPPTTTAPREDVGGEIEALARQAVDHARGRGTTLDYSESSIQDVERVLGRLHDELTARRIARDQALTLARQYGAYVGETIRRRWGGTWSRHEMAGRGAFSLHVKGLDTFPMTWCMKRVDLGPDDNIWSKYQLGVVSPPPELAEEE